MFADVTSANVVGYHGKTVVKKRYNQLVSDFVDVAGKGYITLSELNIKPVATGESFSFGNNQIAIWGIYGDPQYICDDEELERVSPEAFERFGANEDVMPTPSPGRVILT